MLTEMVQIATLISTIVGVIGLFVAIQVYRRQSNAQLFLEYTKRYEDIMMSFPPDARLARLHLDGDPPPPSHEVSIAILRYLNLCSEEFYMYTSGYLSRKIWLIWKSELERTILSPLFKREWPKLQSEFVSYPEFLDYVNQIQNRTSRTSQCKQGRIKETE